MRIEQGEKVFTIDGEVVGEVHRVVIDPKTNEVTHIVVEKGFLFTEERVVPIDLVQYSDEDKVALRDAPVDFNDLPVFEETPYIPLDDEELKRLESEIGASAYYRYPPLYPGGGATESAVARPYLKKTIENIPEEIVTL